MGILALLGTLFGRAPDAQEAKAGEPHPLQEKAGALYSVEGGDGRYSVVKILAVEHAGIHLRLYKNMFDSRPATVEFRSLSMGTIWDKDGCGLAHYPITRRQFRAWRPAYLGDSPVAEEELEGYRVWQQNENGRFHGLRDRSMPEGSNLELCPICTPTEASTRNAAPTRNDFVRVKKLYSESHEGASLSRCRQCGCTGISYWVEIYDEIWDYWVQASELECEMLCRDEPGDSVFSAGRRFRKFFKWREHLSQTPANLRSWGTGEILDGPPW